MIIDRVIATAGPAKAAALRRAGAAVTSYGAGMAGRVTALATGRVDRALDATPASGALPALIELTGAADRVLTIADFAAAATLGTRIDLRYDSLNDIARLAGAGVLTVMIARTHPLEAVREAAALSRSGHPGGKLLLLP
ncbi:zinc-binding dehydrogenase [Symbioplanes lichenis]|uniref:zinc-binding dehydrogenase n=1 Tax=Symbioplanes lichenis TaxID=1629072 RepID=UPI0027399FC5|nr:zinc-binding dehydrogenase [Actinoplanes lichenis]